MYVPLSTLMSTLKLHCTFHVQIYLYVCNFVLIIVALQLLEFKFVNLLRYCCIPEFSGKKYWHYNFIAETKNSESGTWTRGTYFAETKLEHGVQNFFCCLLDLSDNGECYGCKNQKAEIQHPTRGDYQRATPDHDWPSNDDEISDDDSMDC